MASPRNAIAARPTTGPANAAIDTTPTWTYDSVPLGTSLAFGDINGDGWDDLAIGYSGQPSIVVFYATPIRTLGDMNCDGAVNFDDIDGFVTALVGEAAYAAAYPECDWLSGDINGSGGVDFDDIDGFVTCLTAGECD